MFRELLNFVEYFPGMSQDTPIVAYCAAGVRAQTAVLLLAAEAGRIISQGFA